MERGSEYDVTAKLVIRHEQELSATLTEQQKAILEKIKDNLTELMSFGERDAFCPNFALCRANKKCAVVPEQAEQIPHGRFVGDCKRYFRGRRKCSGLALLHFRSYQFYQIFMEHIARYAVALRVSNDDSVKLLWQPLLTESAIAEISVKVRDRQHNFIGIKRFVD